MKTLTLLCLFCVLSCSAALARQSNNDTLLTKQFLTLQQRGQFAEALQLMDAGVTSRLNESGLRSIWTDQIQFANGSYRRSWTSEIIPQQSYTTIIETCVFDRHTIRIRFIFSPAHKILSYTLAEDMPPISPASTSPLSDRPSSFYTAINVSIPTDGILLNGRLTLPNQPGKYPAAILLGGSGPTDMDGTYGPNKIYRDLADGLSEQGIAVLRYDKRTVANAASMQADYTVADEVTNDAIAALRYLCTLPGVDTSNIFYVGHSLGGMLAPRIAAGQPNVSGIALLEANVRDLGVTVLEQLDYLHSRKTMSNDVYDKMRRQWQRVASDTLSAAASIDSLPDHVRAGYWLDLKQYDPGLVAASLGIPIFIAQGGRDYQVTTKEFDLWKIKLADVPGVTFKFYPTLNHQMISLNTDRPSVPLEYSLPGQVDTQLITDLAAWIRANVRRR
ncbi:alpha/beta hydrolase [Chitinophaga pendula]|uniref:alpha/beta fold hydrolase n=1 Tax=Chitinophaga TaxID=79328 RepID=UPI000BAED097|nr:MULTISPECIES: alpha/beta fold hydrolase [Chitinophaga]ASZ14179.1 hypothetical protein CK934_26125 [Chitinophaga sp. MD30]UCJ08185.1 alpha/beta hydrolase [Chitinophaga pendula]